MGVCGARLQNSIESEQSKRLEEGSAAMKTLNASLMSLQVLTPMQHICRCVYVYISISLG